MNEREIIRSLIHKNPNLFINLISKHYSFDERKIQKVAHLVNWNLLVQNENTIFNESILKNNISSIPFKKLPYKKIFWSEKLVNDLQSNIYWDEFYLNCNFKWTTELIEKYSKNWRFNWSSISANTSIDWTEELIDKYMSNWDWVKLFRNESINWNDFLIEKYKTKWINYLGILGTRKVIETIIEKNISIINFGKLSESENFVWKSEFIEKYKFELDWVLLSSNESLELSADIILIFENYWDYNNLSKNKKVMWSDELLDKYCEKWNWSLLCYNSGLSWTEDLIEKYNGKVNWLILSKNYNNVPWSFVLVEKYKNNWDWMLISANTVLPWSIEIIEKYESKLYWNILSFNRSLPWNEKFLLLHKDKLFAYCHHFMKYVYWNKQLLVEYKQIINFEILSSLSTVEWSIEVLTMFAGNFNWRLLALNESVQWTDEKIIPFIYYFDNDVETRNSCMSFDKMYSYEKYMEGGTDWKELCFNKNIQLSEKFIDNHKDKLYWEYLVCNNSINFNINFIEKYISYLHESVYIWDIIKNIFNFNFVEYVLFEIQKSKLKIANSLTILNWEQKLIACPNVEHSIYYYDLFNFFEERITTRYLNPIKEIMKMKCNEGEGFAILNLQCSLIETIECFINGWKYNTKSRGWYYKDERQKFNNSYIFENFFKKRLPFCEYNIDGSDFYNSIRCSLLHETQTKNNWIISSKFYGFPIHKKVIYRNEFQKAIEKVIQDYKYSFIRSESLNDISGKKLRENFISKFNHICNESLALEN